MGMCVKISQKQCNVITKNVHKLMRVDGDEQILVKGFAFKNSKLKAFADSHPFDYEKIAFVPVSDDYWEVHNPYRQYVCELNPYDLEPLPIKINEGEYLEALNKIKDALAESVPYFCINVIFVKVPKKRNHRIAYLEIVKPGEAWLF